jgi:hypothetical protein
MRFMRPALAVSVVGALPARCLMWDKENAGQMLTAVAQLDDRQLRVPDGLGLVQIRILMWASSAFASGGYIPVMRRSCSGDVADRSCCLRSRIRRLLRDHRLRHPAAVLHEQRLRALDAMPGWMEAVARANPLTYAINAMRHLVIDGWTSSLPGDLLVLFAFASLCLAPASPSSARSDRPHLSAYSADSARPLPFFRLASSMGEGQA